MTRHLYTPPFRTSTGEIPPGSIAECRYRPLGGVDQWVMIRGRNVANPPLIFLHGGPGMSETSMLRTFNAALEDLFTVVYWDQRGTGKSFQRTIPKSSMTVAQFVSDLDELVDAVLDRLGASKVVILGHSWGSALGVLYAATHPAKVSAYVGAAQVGDWAAAEHASYALAVANAERLHDEQALRKLRGIGPPPYDARCVLTERTVATRLAGQMDLAALRKMPRILLGNPESSIFDLPDLWRGFRFSLDAMWEEVSRLNMIALAPVLLMPVFFLLGRRDPWIPPETSQAYFEALAAPSKRLVWFEESAHEPFVDEPEKFNAAMIELVRPAVMLARTA